MVHTGLGKSWKFMEFKVHILQAWKVLISDLGHGKPVGMFCINPVVTSASQ